jgi:predicted O-methyltransferase YrrM
MDSLNILYPVTPTNPMLCVEIGSFEGKGSLLIANRLCQNTESKLYCIDPFDDEYVKGDPRMTFWDSACKGQRGRFYQNTKDVSSIVVLQGTSDAMIPNICDASVDFAYIDGDHSPEQVYKDATNIFCKMKKGGIILFDDYCWVVNGMKTADGIDRFLGEKMGSVELLLKKWQLAIRIL